MNNKPHPYNKEKTCTQCGSSFTGKMWNAKFCIDCRKKNGTYFPYRSLKDISPFKKEQKSLIEESRLEETFKKWFIENGRDFKFTEIKAEAPLFKAYALLSQRTSEDFGVERKISTRENIGKIDLLFRFSSVDYVCEVKYYPFNNSEFWDCLKVLGYCHYYNWQHDAKRKPCVMLPKDKIKLEHFLTAQKLELDIFGITKQEDGYEIEKIIAPDYKSFL